MSKRTRIKIEDLNPAEMIDIAGDNIHGGFQEWLDGQKIVNALVSKISKDRHELASTVVRNLR